MNNLGNVANVKKVFINGKWALVTDNLTAIRSRWKFYSFIKRRNWKSLDLCFCNNFSKLSTDSISQSLIIDVAWRENEWKFLFRVASCSLARPLIFLIWSHDSTRSSLGRIVRSWMLNEIRGKFYAILNCSQFNAGNERITAHKLLHLCALYANIKGRSWSWYDNIISERFSAWSRSLHSLLHSQSIFAWLQCAFVRRRTTRSTTVSMSMKY